MTRVLFLDDGGVLSDNERRATQWRAHVGEFLARELGGDPAAWQEANRLALARLDKRFYDAASRSRFRPGSYWRQDGVLWLADMCAHVKVPMPAEDAAAEIAQRASRYVTERVRAFYPDVIATLRELRARGHIVHTSSGAMEADLDGYLRAEGVRDLFGTLYGSDIVDTWKLGPDFYRAVLAHSGADAHDAVTVDDSRAAVGWARDCGMKALLLRRDDPSGDLRSLADLLRALA